jgi:hypothetical protein
MEFITHEKVKDAADYMAEAVRCRKAGQPIPPIPDGQEDSVQFLKTVELLVGGMAHTPEAARRARKKMNAMINTFGIPNVFITIAPDDSSLIFHHVLRKPGEEPRVESRHVAMATLSQDPGAGALSFERILQVFLEDLCAWDTKNKRPKDKPGILGRIRGYFGAVEEQDRLSLHAHFVFWVDGLSQPMRDLLGDDEHKVTAAKALLSRYTDKVFSTSLGLPAHHFSCPGAAVREPSVQSMASKCPIKSEHRTQDRPWTEAESGIPAVVGDHSDPAAADQHSDSGHRSESGCQLSSVVHKGGLLRARRVQAWKKTYDPTILHCSCTCPAGGEIGDSGTSSCDGTLDVNLNLDTGSTIEEVSMDGGVESVDDCNEDVQESRKCDDESPAPPTKRLKRAHSHSVAANNVTGSALAVGKLHEPQPGVRPSPCAAGGSCSCAASDGQACHCITCPGYGILDVLDSTLRRLCPAGVDVKRGQDNFNPSPILVSERDTSAISASACHDLNEAQLKEALLKRTTRCGYSNTIVYVTFYQLDILKFRSTTLT